MANIFSFTFASYRQDAYTYKNEAKVKEKMFAIRKTWYLLFVLGSMVYWTYDPEYAYTYKMSAAAIVHTMI
jgi:hypothetical protein